MSGQIANITPDDTRRLERVLDDVGADGMTRRVLLRRAAVTTALACAAAPGVALARATSTSLTEIVDTAVTAEALAVTYLTGLVRDASAAGVGRFVEVLRAANAAEYDHYRALERLGAKPVTTRFWVPDAFFEPGEPFKVLETAETLFVDAYLIAATAFAAAGKADLARYAGEIGAVEAQHLALARLAQDKLPDDRAFQAYAISDIGGIVAALQRAGIGFGKRGQGRGRFHEFSPPPAAALTAITGRVPM